jgi:uncharacterized 2Fe-2S/4Fe-4S cluster protein (DUF4445 family)
VAKEGGIDRHDISKCVFVGNPIMHHLFLGIDPTELGQAPFALAVSARCDIGHREIGLTSIPARGSTRCPASPAMSARMRPARRCPKGRIRRRDDAAGRCRHQCRDRARQPAGVVAASSPTGPAFEGAQISSGQRAAPGAIERVRIDPETLEPRYKVIGVEMWSDEPGFERPCRPASPASAARPSSRWSPRCISRGIIDRTASSMARWRPKARASSPTAAPSPTCSARRWPKPRITVTQNDVRAIQLAKAALYAGVKLLMDKLGIEKVDRITLRRRLRLHHRPKYAMVLGLIPDCDLAEGRPSGNAAGTGARIALLNLLTSTRSFPRRRSFWPRPSKKKKRRPRAARAAAAGRVLKPRRCALIFLPSAPRVCRPPSLLKSMA